MVHLASLPPGSRVSRSHLAAAIECPEQFLSKILQSLAKAGLVASHRGNTGGFELPDAQRNASLLDVVEAVEGPLRLNFCLTGEHACARQRGCAAHDAWSEAQQALASVLSGATLAVIAERGNGNWVSAEKGPAAE